jgi:hypothetical protein
MQVLEVKRIGDDGEIYRQTLYSKQLTYRVDLSGGTSLTLTHIDEVLRQDNSRRKSNSTNSVSNPGRYATLHARVRLNDSPYSPVTYDLSGNYQDVMLLSDKLDDFLPGLRQWYSYVS